MSDSSTLHPIRPAVLVAVALALSSSAWAQAQFQGTTIVHPHPINNYMSGNAQKAVIGQLTEDAIRDVALLQGGKIVLLYAPDRQEWFKRSTGYNGTYSDIAVLPGDFAGDPDTLLALRPEGLVRLQWDPAQRVLEDEGPPLASGDWCGARLLRVVPGVEGLDNVAAVTSGGDVVYAVLDTGSFQDGGTLDTTVVNAIAFEALDLHGNGDIEYAFDDGTGLRVFSSGGSPIPTCPPNASPEPRLLRLPEAAGKDALVWVSSLLPSIPQALTVVRMGTTSLTFENAIQLPVPSAEFALADYYGDTKLDLLGVSSVDSAVRVLQNQHVFGGPQAHTFGFTPPGPPLETFYFDASQVYGGTAPPALAAGDLDGDGDADLVLAGHAGGSGLVKVFLSDGIDEDLFRPEVDECVRKAPSCLAFYDGGNTGGFELNIYQQVGGGTDVRVETWVLDAAISQWSAWPPLPPAPLEPPFTVVFPSGPLSPTGGHEEIFVQFWIVEIQGGREIRAWPASTLWVDRDFRERDPGGINGFNEPPNIQPGGEGPDPP